jgi:hypothetical protein
MKGTHQGYTILEVLIFIAVSALIFVAAIVAIGGRQNQVQFAQGVREFEAKIQDTLNDVTTGYFASNPTIKCQIVGGNVSFDFTSTNVEKLGGNNSCLFVGKVMQVLPAGANGDVTLVIYNLAGKRYLDTANSVIADTITEVGPKMVSTTTVGEVDSAEEYVTRFGIKITKLTEVTSVVPAPIFGAFAIMSKLGGGGVSANNSQAQQVNVGTILGSTSGLDEVAIRTVVNQLNDTATSSNGYFNYGSKGVVICLQDSSSNKKASVTVSASGTQLKIDDYERSCD